MMPDLLDSIWGELLSRDHERIREAFTNLPGQEKIAVRGHLIRMATEEGWQAVQVESVQMALDAVQDIADID